MAERRGFRGFLAARRLSWRYFWSRRAPWRIRLGSVSGVGALLIVVYLVNPGDAQSWVNRALQTAGRFIAALNSVEILAGAAGLLAVLCLGFIFIRPYRRATYLATTPSAIPLISVYVDAENQLSEAAIRPFTKFLIKYLSGRRADLLYFLDASNYRQGAHSDKYKTLYRFGFRPVDVPHDPTGTVSVKEAVDKELSMHAYERALLGPANQEFIIVTGDQDFVALVYRLAALGHHVQVWATPIRPAYRALATYLDIELIDLAHVISDTTSSRQEENDDADDAMAGHEVHAPMPDRVPASRGNGTSPSYETSSLTLLSEAGEQQIYRAVVQTLNARNDCERRFSTEAQRVGTFRGMLGGELGPRLASVGYAASSKIDYWIEHLRTVDVFTQQGKQKDQLPMAGATSPENAAHALFEVAQLAADATIAVGREHGDEAFSVSEIATKLLAQQDQARGLVRSLLGLIARGNKKRATHARYFVRCAQALGLVEFDDVPDSLDMIRSPRLIETPLSDEPEENRQAEIEAAADDAADADAATDVVTDADPPTVPDEADPYRPEAPPDEAL